jgi:hypothetical protein
MPAELMYGAHFAKDYVTTFLQQDMPSRLVRYRNGWNLDDNTLPDPQLYLSYEPLALDTWPTIITVAINASSFSRFSHEPGFDPIYNVTYALRTYVWVRGGNSEEATLMRDRLTAVVRSALLDYPCFNRHDTTRDARVEESTLTEEYSDLTLLKGDRVMAGAFVGYNVVMEEAITREPLGIFEEYDLEVTSTALTESFQV